MRWTVPIMVAAATLVSAVALAQGMNHTGAMPMHEHGPAMGAGTMPHMPGQEAFGTVQEIAAILRADPATDWSKVNLDALREHLIEMNEVALNADAKVERIEGGIRVAVTGTGRTLVAIQRMLPAHAQEMNGQDGWKMLAEPRADGMTLTVTSADAKQVAMIRGLGFIGVMASGDHHQAHHLMIAKGGM